jgi:hypothetical protein
MNKKIIIGVVVVIILIIIVILLIPKSDNDGGDCESGYYSDNGKEPCNECTKCTNGYISQCIKTKNSVCNGDDDGFSPSSDSKVFDSTNTKNIAVKDSLYVRIDDRTYIKITENDLKRFFGGHTYDKYCPPAVINDNCIKFGFNSTSPSTMKDNANKDECKKDSDLPDYCISKGPFNVFVNNSKSIGPSLLNLTSKSGFETDCYEDGTEGGTYPNTKEEWPIYILPTTGDGQRYSKLSDDILNDKYKNIDTKFELKALSDFDTGDFINVNNLVIDSIQFNFESFIDYSVTPNQETKIQGGKNFILNKDSAGIISGTGGTFVTNATTTQNQKWHCQVGSKWLTLPDPSVPFNNKNDNTYIFQMMDPNEVTVVNSRTIKIKENVTDSTGELLNNYKKGKGVAYTNNYFCIGNTCVSAELFWMVIPGTIMDSTNTNPLTKEFVILIPHTLKPNEDDDESIRHIYGNHAGVSYEEVKRSENIKDICNTDHRWHFTPPVLNTLVNTFPWKKECSTCNCGS